MKVLNYNSGKPSIQFEVGDELEITYLMGKRYLGKYVVTAVYGSTIAAKAEHSPQSLCFPNPSSPNFTQGTMYTLNSDGNMEILLLEDGSKLPWYRYIVGWDIDDTYDKVSV